MLFEPTEAVTDTSDWLPFAFPYDQPLEAGSAPDASGLLDAPAGKYGKLASVGDHFEFADRPGHPVRFFPVNLVAPPDASLGADAGTPDQLGESGNDDGCGCSTTHSSGWGPFVWVLAGLVACRRRARRVPEFKVDLTFTTAASQRWQTTTTTDVARGLPATTFTCIGNGSGFLKQFGVPKTAPSPSGLPCASTGSPTGMPGMSPIIDSSRGAPSADAATSGHHRHEAHRKHAHGPMVHVAADQQCWVQIPFCSLETSRPNTDDAADQFSTPIPPTSLTPSRGLAGPSLPPRRGEGPGMGVSNPSGAEFRLTNGRDLPPNRFEPTQGGICTQQCLSVPPFRCSATKAEGLACEAPPNM